MMDTLRLRVRIAAGHIYAAGYGLGGELLRKMIPAGSPLERQKRRLARMLRPQPKRKLEFLLAAFARAYPQARFVQIGANDGMLEDPLREFILANRWRGVLVEPVPYLFERLQRTYRDIDRVSLENVAIADREGSMPFYYVRESSGDPTVPVWHAGLGSFSRAV